MNKEDTGKWRLFKGPSKKQDTRVVPEPDFPVLAGMPYLEFLERYHQEKRPHSYLEIGTRHGDSLTYASGHCVAIDPAFKLSFEVMGPKDSLYLYQGTSDDFFASGHLDATGRSIDFAFLDGMHLFEYLLRDVMHIERHMSPDGALVMHDCVPYARAMASRAWDKSKMKSWTGDVWKLIPILREWRPDLRVRVLDCPPTALVMVDGFDAGNSVLADAYDEIIERFTDLDLATFGVDRFVTELDLVSAADVLREAAA